MVITRNKMSKTPTLQHWIGKEQMKTWQDDSLKTASENTKITPHNGSSLAASVHPFSESDKAPQRDDAHQGLTLKCLVSQLAEEELTALLKLAGKQTQGDNSFEEVLQMLQGEEDVIKELHTVGLFPTLPNDVPFGKVTAGDSPITVAVTGLERSKASEEEDSYGISGMPSPNSLENNTQWMESKSSSTGGLKLKSMYDEYIIDLINVSGLKNFRGKNKKKLHHGLLLQCGEEVKTSGSMKRSRRQ